MAKHKLTLKEYFGEQKNNKVREVKDAMCVTLKIKPRNLSSYIHCNGPVPKNKQEEISQFINELPAPKGTTYIIDWDKMALQYVQNMANRFTKQLEPQPRTKRATPKAKPLTASI